MSIALTVFLLAFFGLLIVGTPIAFAMTLSALAWVAVSDRWAVLPVLPERVFQGIDSFVLLAIPLFILAGEIISAGRVTDRLVTFANVLFGWMRGGLAQVNIGASIVFSGITGVALGDIAALGRVFIPAMVRDGYTAAYAAAVTASSSIIGAMVPPSLIVIIYGSVTDVSIGALMAACIVPGLLIGAAQIALVVVQSRRAGFPPVAMDRSPPAIARASWEAAGPLMIPVIILAGILGGIMTPTEAGAVAAAYALILTVFWYRTLGARDIHGVFSRSAIFTAQLLIIVGCGAVFSWVMAMENVPALLSGLVNDLDLSATQALLIFNLVLLVIGMVIDPMAAIILFGPIMARAAMVAGVDPLHFGAVMILNLNIGLLTPPLGVCLFAAERIAGCGLGPLIRATLPFLAVNLAALLLVSMVPAFSLALPRWLGF
jgi:C4-dicarboxylate transporter, DctM subunit